MAAEIAQFSEKRSWADLPKEMVASIARKLQNRHDVLHCRAVCRSWRNGVPFPRRSSISPLELQSVADYASGLVYSYALAERTVFRLELDAGDGSGKQSCLLKLQELKEDGKFRFLNPFSKFPMKNRPKSLPGSLNIRDLIVSEVTRSFTIERTAEHRSFAGNPVFDDDLGWIHKAVIPSNFEENESPNIVLIKNGELWRINSGEGRRYLLDRKVELRDIVNFNNKLYTLDIYGLVTGYEQSRIHLIEFYPRPTERICYGERYFVESKGDLFSVHREFIPGTGVVYYDQRSDGFVSGNGGIPLPFNFRVFKGDKTEFGFNFIWEEIKDLEERVFFVSHDCSFSFSAHDFPGLRGNCIIYVDQVEDGYEEEEDDDGEELEQVKKGKVGIYFMEEGRYAPITSFPEYLSIFWPIPSWLRSEAGTSSGH